MIKASIISLVSDFNQDPKHLGIIWKSQDYRDWLQKNKSCYCGNPLSLQQGWLHHHRNTGGKKPLDQFLTRFCSYCHEKIHFSFAVKDELYTKFRLTDDLITQDCVKQVFEYVTNELGAWDIVLNYLTITALEKEKEEVIN